MRNNEEMKLRSAAWFDIPGDPLMTALYLERYVNFGLTREELQSGKPIIGIAQTGSDLSPCNRHHLELAQRGERRDQGSGRNLLRVSCSPDSRNRKATDGLIRPQSGLSGACRNPSGLPAGWSGLNNRLRQDHTRVSDGRCDSQHSGDRFIGRTDAEWLAPR